MSNGAMLTKEADAVETDSGVAAVTDKCIDAGAFVPRPEHETGYQL